MPTSATAPRIRIVDIVEVGCIRDGIPAIDDRAVIGNVGAEERSERILLRVGTVPALPAVDTPRVDQLGTPGSISEVLLAYQVHVNGLVGSGSCLRNCQNSSNSEHHRSDHSDDLLLNDHDSPYFSNYWNFQQF